MLGYSLNSHNSQIWTSPAPESRNSSGTEPNASFITCCLPSTVAGSWIESGAVGYATLAVIWNVSIAGLGLTHCATTPSLENTTWTGRCGQWERITLMGTIPSKE